ncbi:hypothetical protein Vadar_023501 [Vaccinium darrowii]|uniref:Uncharacterized protein n=1 Tax=Vaccinium darrowii TaxID=229202 RepID=A0ACB7YHQ2_9ERIC|nr:hypothetical protein Vadar_023501 [Vaccinium darrowii]
MQRDGVRPNGFSLATALKGCSMYMDIGFGKRVHAEESNAVSWSTLLHGYARMGEGDKVLRLFLGITELETRFSCFILSTFLNGCSKFQLCIARNVACLSNVKIGKQVQAHIVKNYLSENTYVGTPLVNMYAKNMCMDDAAILFHTLRKKGLSAWTAVISGYAQNYKVYKAMECFSQMQQEGLKPNEFALPSCFSGCSNLAALETGKQFHSLALK